MILFPAEGGQDLSLHTSFAMYGLKLLIRTDNSLIFLSYKAGQDLSLHISFTMYGCKLLIRTDNSIITNDIPPSEGWTGLIRVTRLDEDLTCSTCGAFVYFSSNNH
jgi:hypothetical protein